jgi:hypothetical protein
MSPASQRAGSWLPARLAVTLAATGGICLVAGMLIAFLVADHSSSDSSVSSLIAIGLAGLGFLAVVLGALLLGGIALARLWRRLQRPRLKVPGGR